MRHSRFWIVAIAAVVALSGLVGAYASGRLMAAKPTAVGCVDVFQVLTTAKEKVQIDADLRAMEERMRQEDQDRRAKLKDMETGMEVLNPGTPDRLKAEEDLVLKTLEYRAWAELQKVKLTREQKLRYEGLYKRVLSTTASVAKDAGFDMVMYKEGVVDFSRIQDPRLIDDVMRARKVLYAAEGMDITEQVKTRMDNEFNNPH
jgi:Skp family chaperone for outer membrane proteins